MTATVPSRCDCGGEIYAQDGSYWEPTETWGCGDCGRSDEQIAAQHDTTTCTTPDCGWCALVTDGDVACPACGTTDWVMHESGFYVCGECEGAYPVTEFKR